MATMYPQLIIESDDISDPVTLVMIEDGKWSLWANFLKLLM
jgi:hypothetical protein